MSITTLGFAHISVLRLESPPPHTHTHTHTGSDRSFTVSSRPSSIHYEGVIGGEKRDRASTEMRYDPTPLDPGNVSFIIGSRNVAGDSFYNICKFRTLTETSKL